MGLLDGRVALVTGGARGIGLEVGRRFAAEGAKVALADLSAETVRAAAAMLVPPDRVIGVELDVTDPPSVARAFDQVESRLGLVDVVVANAGILKLQHGVDLPAEDFRAVLEVNLTGSFVTCTEGARRLLAHQRPGRIIVTSSLFGLRGGVENAAYSASKFGCIGLVQCLAAELGPKGITVNAVCPGQVATPMMSELLAERARLTGRPAEAVEQDLVRRIPVGRMATPAEVADSYVWLASDLAGYVNGQSVTVDGGWQVG